VTPSEDPAGAVSLDPKSARYTREITERLLAALGDELVGVYLHGSAVLGDFARGRSDLDVVAVSNGPLTTDEINVLAERLSSASLPCPARGLELHVVDRRTVAALVEPPFELHIATTPHRVVVGRRHGGDADLVMHYAVLCDHGVALTGPPASELFPWVPRERLVQVFAGELRWALEDGSPAYQVLNACRAWRFLDEDVLTSKLAGATWARERVEDPALIDVALRHRRGESDAQPPARDARMFVETVLERLDAG
jgi:Aminoglycoside adenylyltransferase, C-terminal domain/Nucleotidyltransferase domain